MVSITLYDKDGVLVPVGFEPTKPAKVGRFKIGCVCQFHHGTIRCSQEEEQPSLAAKKVYF